MGGRNPQTTPSLFFYPEAGGRWKGPGPKGTFPRSTKVSPFDEFAGQLGGKQKFPGVRGVRIASGGGRLWMRVKSVSSEVSIVCSRLTWEFGITSCPRGIVNLIPPACDVSDSY